MDTEANDLLNQAAIDLGHIPVSNIICALIRAMAGISPKQREEPVYTQLKRVFGREQFLNFLQAVAVALPRESEPVVPEDANDEFLPQSWLIKEEEDGMPVKVGVMAFFNPSGENIGKLFTEASGFKAAHKVPKVYVIVPLEDVVPIETRNDMRSAGINIISLAGLAKGLAITVGVRAGRSFEQFKRSRAKKRK